jgi:hypothetical protein
MKTIIAGSRGISDFATVSQAIVASKFEITEVVSGTARGVDLEGEAWASLNEVPIKRFPAEWNKDGIYDPGAGYKRNKQMALYADALIAVWDGKSAGTRNMINEAAKAGLKLYVHSTG